VTKSGFSFFEAALSDGLNHILCFVLNIFFGLDAFYQAKKVLNAPNSGCGGLIALFWRRMKGGRLKP
jgi:hypothetical protein